MSQSQTPDARTFFVLPQAPEDAGYYTYGTPSGGNAQFVHPKMLSFLFLLEHRWSAIDARKIGIGNISLANGVPFPPHRSHKSGLEVDIRPLRKDGLQLPVRYQDNHYDREGTKKLVELMLGTGLVKRVMFNDSQIRGVHRLAGHDDHLHVEANV